MYRSMSVLLSLALFTLISCRAKSSRVDSDSAGGGDTGHGPVCRAGSEDDEVVQDWEGIYNHQIFRGHSEDGFTFTDESVLLLDHASAPDATIDEEGQRSIYFVNGEVGKHGIWRAIENEEGVFVIDDCVRLDGVFNGDAVDPDIVRLPTGELRMYYYEGSFIGVADPSEDGVDRILAATSTDGIHFEVDGIAFEAENANEPSVVKLPDGSWLMAIASGTEGHKTLLAHSVDGLTFSLTGAGLDGGVPELMMTADGDIRCFITGFGIESHISRDNGATWTKESGTRLQAELTDVTADPSAIKISDGTTELYYKTIPL